MDGQALRRPVRDHQDIAVALPGDTALEKMLCMDAARLQCDASQGDGPGIAPRVLLQSGDTVDEILPLPQLHRRVARDGAQGGVIAPAEDGVLLIEAVIVVGLLQIGHELVVRAVVDLVEHILLHRDVRLDIVQIDGAVPLRFPHADIEVKAGFFRHPSHEEPPQDQPRALGHEGGGEDHGDGSHQHPHGGKLGGEGAEDQQVHALVLPGGTPVEEGGHPGGEADEKPVQPHDDAPRAGEPQLAAARHQEDRSRRRQDDGGGEDPAPSLAAPDDRALVLLFKVDEAVDVHLPDAPAAPAQGEEVDEGKIHRRQSDSGQGERQRELVGDAEEGQQDGPQSLVEHVPQDEAQRQGTAPHRQVLQEEEPGYLFVLQTDKQVGPKLPAPAQEHELCGIGYQPAKDAHHDRGGHSNHQGQHIHPLGQSFDLLGEG